MGALQEMDRDIKECEKAIDTSKALERLKKNRDFKKIFLDLFMKDGAIGLVMKKADPDFQSIELQEDIDNQLMAISHVSRFMDNIDELGRIKESVLKNTQFEKDMYIEQGGE